LARSNVEKTHASAEHLAGVSQPHPSEIESEEEEALIHYLETPYQHTPPVNRLKGAEVQEVISSLDRKKSSGYNLVTGNILKEWPIIRIKCLTELFNAVLPKGYFPAQWKVVQLILLLKPRKPPNELTSYLPTSLLPTVSKISERLLLQRHSTIEQTYRIVRRINKALENKQYYSAAFLDISLAFDII
jgi:hypothetical protein